jgi:hypothetical protein
MKSSSNYSVINISDNTNTEETPIKDSIHISEMKDNNANIDLSFSSENSTSDKNSYYLCSKSDCVDCSQSAYFSDTFSKDKKSGDFYSCLDSNCSETEYELTTKSDFYSCTKSNCNKKKYTSTEAKTHKKRRKRKHTSQCSDNCDIKDCKHCKILSSSPQYLGVQYIIANELNAYKLESERGSFQKLYVDGYRVSIDRIKEHNTKRYNIHNNTDNRDFYLCDSHCAENLDNLTYKCNQQSPSGGLLRSVCISGCNDIAKSLNDIIYKPTFCNRGAPDTQVEISIVVAKVDKCKKGSVRYATYKKLDRSVGTAMRNSEETITCLWKGSLPRTCIKKSQDYDTYLWFLVDPITENPQYIGIVEDDTYEITISY